MDFLATMAAASRARWASARASRGDAEVLRAAESAPASAPLVLSPAGFDLIAEVKRSSPSEGRLAGDALSPARQARDYADAGAVAISVLTEPDRFAGKLAHVSEAATELAPVPVMRKDFLVAPYQVIEARAAGASGVLLIAAILDASMLAEMLRITHELGMFALVEVFDHADIDKCGPLLDAPGPDADRACRTLVGVNCRDLRTLAVDFPRFAALAERLPAGLPRVAESGVTTPEHAAEVAGMGYGLALVGTALMRATAPRVLAAELLAAGRAAAGSR